MDEFLRRAAVSAKNGRTAAEDHADRFTVAQKNGTSAETYGEPQTPINRLAAALPSELPEFSTAAHAAKRVILSPGHLLAFDRLPRYYRAPRQELRVLRCLSVAIAFSPWPRIPCGIWPQFCGEWLFTPRRISTWPTAAFAALRPGMSRVWRQHPVGCSFARRLLMVQGPQSRLRRGILFCPSKSRPLEAHPRRELRLDSVLHRLP
jgi:hypothetical protein